jgi:hypothetical protein
VRSAHCIALHLVWSSMKNVVRQLRVDNTGHRLPHAHDHSGQKKESDYYRSFEPSSMDAT